MTSYRFLKVGLLLVLVAGCGSDTEAAGRAQDTPQAAAGSPGAPGATGARGDDPCDLFTPREVATIVGARSELEAVPDEPADGMKSCTWRNRSGEGGMLIVQPCDPGSPWGLSDQPRPGSGGREGCFWEKPGAHQEAVPGIGREARIWRMSEEGMPDYWVAEALTDAGTLEVWVNDAAGRGAALAFLRAAVDRW